MPETTLFFRLLKESDKAGALTEEVRAVREGRGSGRRFAVDPGSFSQVPTSPFAYWVSERVRRLFRELPPFEGEGRTVKVGLQTSDDFRFVRCWWEVPPGRILDGARGPDWREDLEGFQAWCRRRTFEGKRWVPFAKGGAYSPYYADLHLVVNWERDGGEIAAFDRAYIRNAAYYFRPGLTWPRRTTSSMSIRPLPAAVTFGDKGPCAFSSDSSTFLGILQSSSFAFLCGLQIAAGDAAARSYEVGLIQRTPVPAALPDGLALRSQEIVAAKQALASGDELTHVFLLPALVAVGGGSLADRLASLARGLGETAARLDALQAGIDELAFEAYGFSEADRRAVLEEVPQPELIETAVDARRLAADLVSYCVGVVVGRWDLRFATGEREAPGPGDPFDPLPVCPPGMLQGEDGLPLRQAPDGYPMEIDSDGILVDREGHPDDVVARVREVLGLVFGERADGVEAELVELLGVRSLRAYFGKTGAGGFWADHVKRYSASRRTAPIYWLLASPGARVRFWVYAHRFDGDTLPKILGPRYLGGMIEGARQELAELAPGGVARPDLSRRELARVAELEDRLVEMEEMAGEIRQVLERTDDRGGVAGYEPYLDDGVVLAAAPLHRLIPWPKRVRHGGRSISELELRWIELGEGRYDWSATARRYWPGRVAAKCGQDRSLAIAHGLDDGEG